jgi:quinol monooxygenase YgiN
MAKIGREAEVAAIFEKLTAESRKEPGCVMYQVHKHKTDPRRFFIYEQYQDDAALEAHRAAPAFPAVREKRAAQNRRPHRRPFIRTAGVTTKQLSSN